MPIEIQRVADHPDIPSDEELITIARAALEGDATPEICLRIVGEAESLELNATWRGRDRAADVLSFPAALAPQVHPPFLGDVVLCAPLIAREAAARCKPVAHHWAHLVVHGILHLRGFDHIRPAEAARMEARERAILAGLDIPDPYA